MRKHCFIAAALLACALGSQMLAGTCRAAGRGTPCDGGSACAQGPTGCSACESSGGGLLGRSKCGPGGGLHGHHEYEGQDLFYNCGCNGSYKFPVPPLYTYHWPGMYSQQLMTDYQSPWRFPPLKPYRDEADPVDGPAAGIPARLRAVSAVAPVSQTPAPRTGWKPMSERMRELAR